MSALKKISITLAIIVALFAAIGFYISSVYEDEVKNYLITEINNNLNTPVDIEEINFSVFKKFPYASVEFKNVTAKEMSLKEKKDDLFSVKSIFFQFNILDIIKKNYIIKKIAVEDGFVNLKIDKKGDDNFHIWKKDTTQNKEAFKLELTQLLFENISLSTKNDFKAIDFLILFEDVKLSGNFSDQNFELDTKAKLLFQQLNSNKQSWIKNKRVSINTALSVNNETNKYDIKKGNIAIEDLKFNLLGSFTLKENTTELNIKSAGDNLSIESIFSLFPPEQQEKLKSYKAKGNITYHANLKGNYSFTQNPDFDATFKIVNGEILEKQSDVSLTKLSVNGSYLNRKGALTKLVLQNFNANFGAGNIAGNYTITDFNNPYIEFSSKAVIDIAAAKTFFKLDTLEVASGQLNLNLDYSGYLQEIRNVSARDLQNLKATGNVTISNGNLKLVNYPYLITGLESSFQFNNNEISIDSLATNLNSSYIELKGSFKNLLAYLFVDNQKLLVNATFYSKKLILDELLMDDNSTKKDTIYNLTLPQNVSFSLNTRIDHFQFRQFKAEQFSSHLTLQNKQFTASNVSFNAMRGKVNGDFYLDDTEANDITMTSNATITDIDIKELFHQFENFGQDYFVADNIKGIATTQVEFASVWNKKLELNKDKLFVVADLTVNRGELVDYKPAMALAKFIEIDELKHIKFSTLQTHIEIKNQVISISKTDIKSSAIDLTIAGTHSFNNNIDYRFKVLMNDVLWKKAKSKKKENTEFGYVEDDGLGKTALFLHMTGTVKNYKITYDTKGLKEKWSDDIKEEKRNLKQILKEEFGWFKKDSTLADPKKPKKDGFLIEWEEDTRKSEVGSGKKGDGNKKSEDRSQKTEEKKGLGKLIDKIAKPDAEEYEENGDF